MIEKRVTITVPKDIKASELLSFAEEALKEHTKQGWKVGGMLHTKSLDKTVILYQ